MSYDLAVWEGERPGTDSDAAEAFELLMDQYQEALPFPEPTHAIRDFVEALIDRWPDITDEGGAESPWSDGPLMNNAAGPIVYFGMVYSKAEEGATFAAGLAQRHGLVCFDPQTMALLPSKS